MVRVQEVAWPPLPAHWWTLYPCRQVGGRWPEVEGGGEKEKGGGGRGRGKEGGGGVSEEGTPSLL